MANDFKRFTVTNVNTSSGASASSVYSVPAGAGSSALESIVIGITVANTSATGITADVFLDNHTGSNDVYVVKGASIPAGSSLEVMAGNKLVLQNDGSAGDVIRVSASASSSADAIVSVLEDV
tara:strand:+ start:887 stop:1255 length:369 start_codon:yes stop_codon:yes gene_type:complete